MYLAYVDDSGDSKRATTLTTMLIQPQHWAEVLHAWLQGRRAIHAEFGVGKNTELHALTLYKGRGRYCETPEQEAVFGRPQRAASGRIVLSHLSRCAHWSLVTLASSGISTPTAYARTVAYLEDWAATMDTQVMIFYDGPQGLHQDDSEPSPSTQGLMAQWDAALRNAAPYRRVHRGLEIDRRRVIEDPVMQDSRYSQLIQAVDLMAYGAHHRHRQHRPDVWGTQITPVADAIRAYMTTRAHWLPDCDEHGVVWLG
ncbi:DUF3800 domain-containing protein [Cellulomonas sp. NPDC089187]|uniref:DUF3800 domain-containing protein n=1 Tax=Cellulomonas sp. NPDC089187 TaxID=3154970 RepID=UPI00341A83C0